MRSLGRSSPRSTPRPKFTARMRAFTTCFRGRFIPPSARRIFATGTAQQGGDPYSSLGYNLASALTAIHARGDLMQAILKDVGLTKQKKRRRKSTSIEDFII